MNSYIMSSEVSLVHRVSLVLIILSRLVFLLDGRAELQDGLMTDLQRRNETSCRRMARQAIGK